jgi:hypothetical protein
MNVMTNDMHSNYDPLQPSLFGTLGHGGPGIQASYTWGKSIDTTSVGAGQHPLGTQFTFAGRDHEKPFAVVAVVGDTRTVSLAEPGPVLIYVPYWYRCDKFGGTRGAYAAEPDGNGRRDSQDDLGR